MRIRIITKLATLLVLLLGTSVNGLFFHYPKNALLDFFQSFHHKKEIKKPTQNIHHYHMHYYPVHTQILTKPVRAPIKIELEKLHSNHLEALGWSDNEYQHVPEPEIYHSSSPLDDAWPESSLTRPASIWDPEIPGISPNAVEEPEVKKAGIIVQVPLHQTIIVQQPPSKEEKKETNPLIAFFQGIKRIKNSLFSHRDESEKTDYWNKKSTISDKLNAYVVYAQPEFGRKL